jgi:hypothetical protein
MADATYQPKVYRKQGGDELVVSNGGELNIESGGAITDDGTQASHIADASTSHAITDPADAPADADALRDDLVANTIPDIETALDALGTKINSILTALEGVGITATS